MQFSTFAEFIAMDGHGFYVWLSYGVSILLLSLLVLFSFSKQQDIVKQIKQREQREIRLKKAADLQKQQSSQEVNS
mgnify:CR=1 FL=1